MSAASTPLVLERARVDGDQGAGAREVLRRDTGASRGKRVVRSGEILAVMGPSGSGKSTLLHCLAEILKPDAGTVPVGGLLIDEMREAERSALRPKRFGFVFQFRQLVP